MAAAYGACHDMNVKGKIRKNTYAQEDYLNTEHNMLYNKWNKDLQLGSKICGTTSIVRTTVQDAHHQATLVPGAVHKAPPGCDWRGVTYSEYY